jgi:hypothetical protein
LRLHREWEFLVRFLVREIILSHLLREWDAPAHPAQAVLVAQVEQVVRLVPVALVARVVQVEQVVRLVPVALVARVVQVDSHLVQVLVAVRPVARQVPVALVVRAVVQVPVVVAVLAVEPQVLSVRAVLAVKARLVSQSVLSAKSLNSAQTHHHLVVRLFHAVTVLPFFVCVVVHRFKILQTRLTPPRVS